MLNTHLARQWVPGILAGVALTVGALSISAQEKEAQREQSVAVTQHATPAAGPQLLIEEPVHDFGEVWIKPTLNHTFVVKNTGAAVLKILNVKPSC